MVLTIDVRVYLPFQHSYRTKNKKSGDSLRKNLQLISSHQPVHTQIWQFIASMFKLSSYQMRYRKTRYCHYRVVLSKRRTMGNGITIHVPGTWRDVRSRFSIALMRETLRKTTHQKCSCVNGGTAYECAGTQSLSSRSSSRFSMS